MDKTSKDDVAYSPTSKMGRLRGKFFSQISDFMSQIWTLKAPLMVVVSVLGVLPLLILVSSQEARCAYVLIVMASLWLTEAIPIPVTALFPVFMFPITGVLTATETANSYMGNTSLLFIGGLLVAVAVEECNLHRRLALNILKLVGSDPKWIMLGLMLATWFLSMWISNTATASMMMPIVAAILGQLKPKKSDSTDEEEALALSETICNTEKKKAALESGERVSEYGVYRKKSDPDRDSQLSEVTNDRRLSADAQRAATYLQECGVTDPVRSSHHKGKDTAETELSDVIVNPAVDSNPDQNGFTDKLPPVTGGKANQFETNNSDVSKTKTSTDDATEGKQDAEYRRLCKALSLCVAYAANTGGTATLTGTPPNLVFDGQAEKLFKPYQVDTGVTFLNWLLMGFPLALILVAMAWLWLGVFFLRRRFFVPDNSRRKAVQNIIHTEHQKIGTISFAEVCTLILALILAFLWLSRKPEFVDGWSDLFKDGYVSDSTCAVLIGCLLFILPGKRPNVFCWRTLENGVPTKPSYTPLLTWKVAQKKLPWGIIILLGGGFALAKACTRSGLSSWLGDKLATFDELDSWLLNLVICTIVAMATEVTSNTATATLLMPVTFELALNLSVNPLYLMASSALATSFAFMMPVATPPNAIVFASGHLSIIDMALAGSVMNVLSVLALTLCVNTWGAAIFDFNDLPDGFKNLTATA